MKLICYGRDERPICTEEEYIYFEDQAEEMSNRTLFFRIQPKQYPENVVHIDLDGMEINTDDDFLELHTTDGMAFLKTEWL